MLDLAGEAFIAFRDTFFGKSGAPVPFQLRPKRTTQDDPFDEYIANVVLANLIKVQCEKAPGPLITPDLVLLRPDSCRNIRASDLADDTQRMLAIEVKKLERTRQGRVARPSGLDYNTTPQCGQVRVYDARGKALDIRGFYLFV